MILFSMMSNAIKKNFSVLDLMKCHHQKRLIVLSHSTRYYSNNTETQTIHQGKGDYSLSLCYYPVKIVEWIKGINKAEIKHLLKPCG